jgi:DNA polymerase-3 subunit gamma/tau
LLKLIEEPPPHLVFVFCTTDLSKVLPTVRSRCQTFVFQRPRLQDLVSVLTRVAEGEGMDAPPQALSLVARAARGSFRDATSTLDQLSAATEGHVTVQSVLQLLGTVEEDALFRICDLVVDRDTAGALTFIEELSEQGHDLGRLVTELIEHLRHLLLVQHMGEVPESLPVTEEARERLRAQANQLGEPAVIRLLDLLAVAVDDMRQGGDPRLPLELAIVKVTRPAADLSRESTAYRLEQLESRGPAPAAAPPQPPTDEPVAGVAAEPVRVPATVGGPPSVELEQLQEAWSRTIVPAVAEKSIPTSSLFGNARPAQLDGDTLTVEFPADASFNRKLAEEPKNTALLRDALYELTGRKLTIEFAVGEGNGDDAHADDDEPAGEDRIIEMLKETFDARERTE